MVWLNYESPRFPFGDTEQKISNLFADDANTIAAASLADPLCVVAGPWANGKTRFLVPRIAQTLTQRGVNVFTVDCEKILLSKPSEFEFFKKQLPTIERGVLLLDDAGGISAYGGNDMVRHVLGFSHESGYHVVPIIAHHPHHGEVATQVSDVWNEEEKAFGGSSRLVRHKPLRLPRQLAKEFVQFIAEAHFRKTWNSESLDYLLNTVPYNLRVLNHLSLYGHYSVTDFIESVIEQMTMIERSLSQDEFLAFKSKVQGDYQKIKGIK